MMADEDFLNGFVCGYCMALGEARREMAEIRQDVDRTLEGAALRTRAQLDAFAQKHGLDVAAPLARPPRVIM
jgi:hypothetical protein